MSKRRIRSIQQKKSMENKENKIYAKREKINRK